MIPLKAIIIFTGTCFTLTVVFFVTGFKDKNYKREYEKYYYKYDSLQEEYNKLYYQHHTDCDSVFEARIKEMMK